MCAWKSFVRAHERTQKSARQIRRRVGVISRAARQIRRRVGVISRAARWLRKLVVSRENGYIQAGNDPTASHLLLTISVCMKIACKRSWTHAKICSTNKATSWCYFSSRSMTKKTRCFSWKRINTSRKRHNSIEFTTNNYCVHENRF